MITPAHQAYNDFVRMVQREASAFGMECRIKPSYSCDETPQIKRAELQVYWNEWQLIAAETPFSRTDEERKMITLPDEWGRIKAGGDIRVV